MADAQALVGGGGEYQDDVVILNGVELAVEGPIRGGMVSEFSAGMKVGRATYSEREHAFWISLEDMSGGFGFREMDVREAGGTHWDNVGGVDLRRPRHITLPGRRDTFDPPNDPSVSALFYHQETIHYSDISGSDALYIAMMEDIYSLDLERGTMTLRYDGSVDGNSNRLGRIVESVTTTGTRFLMASGTSATGGSGLEYVRSTNGTSWTKSSALPATPSANASFQTSDMIVWDGLVIAHAEGDGLVGSSDGIAWEVDSGGALNTHWNTGGAAVSFVGTAMAPWGADAVYFISKGELYILDWYVHNAVRVEDLGNRNVLRLGVVWNGSVIVTDGWNVWEYNPGNAQTVRRIGLFGKDGPPDSAITESGHAGTPNNYHISQFIGGTSDLFAVVRSIGGSGSSTQSWRLAVYNGVGWSWYGSEVTSSQPYAASMGAFPIAISLANVTRAIDVGAFDAQSGTDFTLHTIHLPPTGDVPQRGPGQRFEDGPLSFETGWFDGGFADLEGALLRLTIDGFHITDTETVRVEFRLNDDESASYANLGTYKSNNQEFWFGSLDEHRGVAFKSVQFRVTLDRGIGVEFADSSTQMAEALDNSETDLTVDDSSVFRIGDVVRVDAEHMLITNLSAGSELLTVTRGYNSTTAVTHLDNAQIDTEIGVTPELQSLILVYDKVPRIRTAWTIRVDVSRMIHRGFNIDEETATAESIWSFLKNIVNTPTLAHLVIPSVEPGGINVRISDMPMTLDDFRTQAAGRGVIELQVLETVGP